MMLVNNLPRDGVDSQPRYVVATYLRMLMNSLPKDGNINNLARDGNQQPSQGW